ncbi:MAG: hypothetical protein IKT14_03060 [Clostridiales bacterium]|nr:hypothetical protein [Clostridiales bacterium]
MADKGSDHGIILSVLLVFCHGLLFLVPALIYYIKSKKLQHRDFKDPEYCYPRPCDCFILDGPDISDHLLAYGYTTWTVEDAS